MEWTIPYFAFPTEAGIHKVRRRLYQRMLVKATAVGKSKQKSTFKPLQN